MRILPAAAALLCSLAPALSQASVLLERFHASGETLEEQSFSVTCTITDTGELGIDYRAGYNLRSHRTQQLQIALPALRSSITDAQKGEITSVEPFPVDGPTLRYRAFRYLADGHEVEVLLWEENGSMGRKQLNSAPAAVRLKHFMDLNCGP